MRDGDIKGQALGWKQSVCLRLRHRKDVLIDGKSRAVTSRKMEGSGEVRGHEQSVPHMSLGIIIMYLVPILIHSPAIRQAVAHYMHHPFRTST